MSTIKQASFFLDIKVFMLWKVELWHLHFLMPALSWRRQLCDFIHVRVLWISFWSSAFIQSQCGLFTRPRRTNVFMLNKHKMARFRGTPKQIQIYLLFSKRTWIIGPGGYSILGELKTKIDCHQFSLLLLPNHVVTNELKVAIISNTLKKKNVSTILNFEVERKVMQWWGELIIQLSQQNM